MYVCMYSTCDTYDKINIRTYVYTVYKYICKHACLLAYIHTYIYAQLLMISCAEYIYIRHG